MCKPSASCHRACACLQLSVRPCGYCPHPDRVASCPYFSIEDAGHKERQDIEDKFLSKSKPALPQVPASPLLLSIVAEVCDDCDESDQPSPNPNFSEGPWSCGIGGNALAAHLNPNRRTQLTRPFGCHILTLQERCLPLIHPRLESALNGGFGETHGPIPNEIEFCGCCLLPDGTPLQSAAHPLSPRTNAPIPTRSSTVQNTVQAAAKLCHSDGFKPSLRFQGPEAPLLTPVLPWLNSLAKTVMEQPAITPLEQDMADPALIGQNVMLGSGVMDNQGMVPNFMMQDDKLALFSNMMEAGHAALQPRMTDAVFLGRNSIMDSGGMDHQYIDPKLIMHDDNTAGFGDMTEGGSMPWEDQATIPQVNFAVPSAVQNGSHGSSGGPQNSMHDSAYWSSPAGCFGLRLPETDARKAFAGLDLDNEEWN